MKNLKMRVAALLGGMALVAVLAVFPQEKAEARDRTCFFTPRNCCLGGMSASMGVCPICVGCEDKEITE